MKTICDFMIIQRDNDGFGRAVLEGKLKEPVGLVVARVVNEYNNMEVVPFFPCEINGDTYRAELTIPQGGLYRVEARKAGGKFNGSFPYDWCEYIAIYEHIGVGEIFVMAGQSNMSGYGKDPAYDPPELGVHLFNNSGKWVLAAHPLATTVDPIYPNNDGSSGTSPALSFAKVMHKALNVPIGLISACQGGSSLESWNPAGEEPYLYNAMVDKINEAGKIAGMIWYQGCNETNEEESCTYLEKFTQAVGLWRDKFGYFPIVTAQINRHAFTGNDNDKDWGNVREAQRQAALTIPDVYIVPTMDMVTSDGIHNTSGSNVIVGERLANSMLKNHYGFLGFNAPSVASVVKIDDNTIQLKFTGKCILRTMDDCADGMNVEDEQGIMNCVRATVDGECLNVTTERAIIGKAYFSAYWKKFQPPFYVRDAFGLPMLACYKVEIK